MPTRDKFPAEYFEGNPFEGKTPIEIYRKIQWGNEPRELLPIDAPEPLIALGEAAQLILGDRVIEWDEGEAHLAIGAESNKLYIFPVGTKRIPESGYEAIGEVEQTDYYSDKGGEPGYYYHEHDAPYPQAFQTAGNCFVIEPETEDGVRSYAVGEEGIIG
jgi:hypothetical protein